MPADQPTPPDEQRPFALLLALYGLLLVVAAAAVVLSFTTLRDLARACGYSANTAWLLPVVIDAGAAGGALAWLSRSGATSYGRTLALTLLTVSVAGNALGHGLAAAQDVTIAAVQASWLVVVVVSAIAPAVLGAIVHLAMLVARATDHPADDMPHRTVRDAVLEYGPATEPIPGIRDTPKPATVDEALDTGSADEPQPLADRYPAGPEETKTAHARRVILAEWDAGREPTGGDVDVIVGGKSLGRQQIAKLQKEGHRPPSAGPRLVSAAG